MSLFSKLRTVGGAEFPTRNAPPPKVQAGPAIAVAKKGSSSPASEAPLSSRLSNGLKEFLWQLDGIGRGHLLDMGQARQTTINFFIERGFKVYSEDFLTTLKNFLGVDEQKKKELSADADRSAWTPAARAERFLETTLQYPEQTFDAVLMWDMLDYVDNDLMTKLAARVTSLVRDGGVVFAIFH